MILGSWNFVVHYFLLKGEIKKAFRHYEFGVFLFLLVTAFPLLSYSLGVFYHSAALGIRYGFFEFVSAITTTGFTSLPSYQGVPPSVMGIDEDNAFFLQERKRKIINAGLVGENRLEPIGTQQVFFFERFANKDIGAF